MSAFHQSVYNGLTAAAQREAWKIQAAHAQQAAASSAAFSAASSASSAAEEEEEREKSEETSEQSKQTEASDGNKPDQSNPIDSSNGNKPDQSNPVQSSSHSASSSSLDSEELRELDSPSFAGFYLCNAAYAPLVFRSLARVLHGEQLRLVTAQCCVYVLRFLLTNHVYGDLLPCSLVQDLASLFPLFHRSSP